MARRNTKQVHIVFESHPDTARYMHNRSAPRRKTTTFLFEDYRGTAKTIEKYTPAQLEEILAASKNQPKRHKTFGDFFSAAARKNVRLLGGERATPEQQQRLRQLHAEEEAKQKILAKKISLNAYKEYAVASAEAAKYREKLVVENIKNLLPKGHIEANYGFAHITLRALLRREGIPTSAERQPTVLRTSDTLDMKIKLGIKPTESDYKKAFVSTMLGTTLAKILTGHNLTTASREKIRYYCMVETTLINSLNPQQIDAIVQKCTETNNHFPAVVLTLHSLGLAQSLKGGDVRQFRKAIAEFVKKHSKFWKRKDAVLKMRESKKRHFKASSA